MQIIAQLPAPNDTLIHNKKLKPLIRPLLHHPGNRIIIRIKLLLQSLITRLHDLGHKNRRIRQLGQNIVNQLAQPLRRLGIRLRRVVPAVEVVGREVDEHDVGLQRDGGLDDAADLADDPARVALVLVVGHVAVAHGADHVDGFAGGDEPVAEFRAVAVAVAAKREAKRDGVAEGEDAQGDFGLAG